MQRLLIIGIQHNDAGQPCMKLKKWQVVLSSHFLFVSFSSVSRWLSGWLHSLADVLLFRLFIVLNGATDCVNIHLCHLTTSVAALVWLNLCDWVREPVLWHASKTCPGERVIEGFGEEAVGKNENQCERRQHMQWFSASAQPGSQSVAETTLNVAHWF